MSSHDAEPSNDEHSYAAHGFANEAEYRAAFDDLSLNGSDADDAPSDPNPNGSHGFDDPSKGDSPSVPSGSISFDTSSGRPSFQLPSAMETDVSLEEGEVPDGEPPNPSSGGDPGGRLASSESSKSGRGAAKPAAADRTYRRYAVPKRGGTCQPARVQPPVQSTEPTGIAPLQPDEPTEIRDSVLGWVPHHQQPPADKGMIADALYQALYRVVTDGNNRPAIPAVANQTARVQRDQGSKDAVTAPRTNLPKPHLLRDPHNFLGNIHHFMHLGQMLLHKDWCIAVEAYCRQQIESDSPAFYAFDNAIRSEIRVRDPSTNTYFKNFMDYKSFILDIFRGEGTDATAQIEDVLPRLHVSPQVKLYTAQSCVGLANLIREVFSYSPDGSAYPILHQIARIRVRLPKQANELLKEHELRSNSPIRDYSTLMRYLHMVDASFTSQGKKRAPESRLQAMDARGGSRPRSDGKPPRATNKNRLDNRPACTHCKKRGHAADSCWILHPGKKAEFQARRKARRNGDSSQLQAITSQLAAAFASAIPTISASAAAAAAPKPADKS